MRRQLLGTALWRWLVVLALFVGIALPGMLGALSALAFWTFIIVDLLAQLLRWLFTRWMLSL